jgi:NDP-sugar pyrophosphorylase family protein
VESLQERPDLFLMVMGVDHESLDAGIHVLEPAVFGLSERTGAFSVITLYLELAQEGWVIRPVDVTGQPWFDIGTPEKLETARKWMEGRKGLGPT